MNICYIGLLFYYFFSRSKPYYMPENDTEKYLFLIPAEVQGAGNKIYNDMHNTVPLRQVVPLSPVYTQ